MEVSDILKKSYNIKIFSLNRIRYEELWEDALAYVKRSYQEVNQKFNSSSPFSQLLSVVLHLGRMILYYIEDSITGLNIRTAWRPEQIRGLATLTGHNPGRAISSRCAAKLCYNGSTPEMAGQVVYIPEKISITNTLNNLGYVILFGASNAKMTLDSGNYVNCNIIQGKIQYQQATSDGGILQGYNFAERNYSAIDQYHINIYVNGERWKIVEAFQDMGYQEAAVVVRTGMTGGIDVFFGNGDFGAVPPAGATILAEYLVTTGAGGNFSKDLMNSANYWEFNGVGYLPDGTEVDLNPIMSVTCLTDCIMGTNYENITLTQRLAPYSSRSMVLANSTNYKYFLEKMNMFSIVDVIQGFNTADDTAAEMMYQKAQYKYYMTKTQYENAVNLYGADSDMASQLNEDLIANAKDLKHTAMILRNARMDDNTVYLFLIPNIKNRITSSSNYFNCNENTTFSLTNEEKYNILNLIDMSGQSIISVENKILNAMYPRFAVNITVRIWEEYTYEDIYGSIVDVLSNYFISCKRRDRIPVSDIIAACEGINGVDSVSVYFDADPDNKRMYGNNFNGIDEYGDVVLERKIVNSLGNEVIIRDLYPLFRGGFTNEDGVEYSDVQSPDYLSAVNVTLAGKSSTGLATNIEHKILR